MDARVFALSFFSCLDLLLVVRIPTPFNKIWLVKGYMTCAIVHRLIHLFGKLVIDCCNNFDLTIFQVSISSTTECALTHANHELPSKWMHIAHLASLLQDVRGQLQVQQ